MALENPGLKLAFLLILLTAQPAAAHAVDQLFAEVTSDSTGWRVEVLFDAGFALPEMRDDPDSPAPERDWLVDLSDSGHAALRAGAETYLRECLALLVNGEPFSWQAKFPDWDADPPSFPVLLNNGAYFRITISGPWPPEGGDLAGRLKDGAYPNFVFQTAPDRFLVLRPGKELRLAGIEPSSRKAQPRRSPFPAIILASATALLVLLALLRRRSANHPGS